MSAPIRKPRPQHVPTTLAELVLDLDTRMEGGDALSDVLLPHTEWAALCERAQDEIDQAGGGTGLDALPACSFCREVGHTLEECGVAPRDEEAPPPLKKKATPKTKAKVEKPAPAAPAAQIDLTEAITEKSGNAKPKPPTRATKKFPLNSGVHERCTKCGRMQGAHAGTICPKHAHGEHSDDYDSNGKLLGVMVDGVRKEAAA